MLLEKREGGLSKQDTLVIKGFSILLIILHNYCHLIQPFLDGNQSLFCEEYNTAFFSHVFSSFTSFCLSIFTFWGHYGVIMFVFISGYGITLKYENRDISIRDFFLYNYKKLLGLSMPVFLCVLFWRNFIIKEDIFFVKYIVTQFFLVSNFVYPIKGFIQFGTYWYLGLTLQLYIIYRVFLYRKDIFSPIIFILICQIVQMFVKGSDDILMYLRTNFIGYMLPFCVGNLYARFSCLLPPPPTIVEYSGLSFFLKRIIIIFLSVVMIVLWGMTFETWLWIPIFVILFSLSFSKLLPSCLRKVFSFVGELSPYIFVVHLIPRNLIFKYFIVYANSVVMQVLLISIYIVSTFFLAISYKYILFNAKLNIFRKH